MLSPDVYINWLILRRPTGLLATLADANCSLT